MASRPRREMVTCPYCNETMTKAVHDRWHVPCPLNKTDKEQDDAQDATV